MPTLGEELKRRREGRDKALSDVSEATRIGTRFLKAIEEGNFSTLPGGIFTRSFIRAYAREVGMDEDEAMALYHEQVSPPPESTTPTDVQPGSRAGLSLSITESAEASPTSPPVPKKPVRVWMGVAGAVAAIVVIILIVIGLSKSVSRDEGAQGGARSSPRAGTTAAAPISPASSGLGSDTSEGKPAAPSLGAGAGSGAAPTIPAGQRIAVSVAATDSDSWIKFQVDDGKPEAIILKAGESKVLPDARDKVSLNIGNRKTLKLKINDHDAEFPPDTPNFAAQVVISRDNLQSFFQGPQQGYNNGAR